jgi:hypothetical protein
LEQMTERLHSGLADDLNTNPAIAGLSDPLKRANDLCHTKKVATVFLLKNNYSLFSHSL